jgi:hypothetical protein
MKRTAWLVLALVSVALPTGCVTRRYLITSDPPGALVYHDGQPMGATPVEASFLYYGKYSFRLVKDGYEPLDVMPQLVTPWYEYPGIDFISETIIPFTFRDKQEFHFTLQPAVPVPVGELRTAADNLRARGAQIHPPPGVIVPPQPPPPVVPPGAVGPLPIPPRPAPDVPRPQPPPGPAGTNRGFVTAKETSPAPAPSPPPEPANAP